jgi:hypothetical protein
MSATEEPGNMELYERKDESGRLSIWAEATDDGGVQIVYDDHSALAEKMFGKRDYEHYTKIAEPNLQKLALAMIAKLYSDEFDADTLFRKLCDEHSIEYQTFTW